MEKSSTLHPSVEQFKNFVKRHPLIMKEVKEEGKTLQEFYEEWVILGEDDENWEKYKAKTNKNGARAKQENNKSGEENPINQETMANLFAMLKKLNINDIQHHLTQFNGLVSNIQGIIQQFQSNPSQNQQPTRESPFSFRKD